MKLAKITPSPHLDPDAVRVRVTQFIDARTSKGHEAGWTLGGRNMDSLDIVELTMDVEDEWDVQVSDELWNVDTTIEQVLADAARIVGGAERQP